MELKSSLEGIIEGKVDDSNQTLDNFSHDASLFNIRPKGVVYPKNSSDIKRLVKYASDHSKEISLTARSAGTDMTGGSINNSIIVSLTENFNRIAKIGPDYAITEPGVYYRDFEKETLKHNLILPTFPASREICTVGGMVANNSGGELSLKYGKTEDYVEEINVVLSDGNEYKLSSLSSSELKKKMAQDNFEGEVYRRIFDLVDKNYETVKKAKPHVPKNSAGYNLWDVWDKKNFDLSKLLIGSQGTLGIVTKIKFRLVPPPKNSHLLVIFLEDTRDLVGVVDKLLPYSPLSLESYDDHTLGLALKYLPELIKIIKPTNLFKLAIGFIPELWLLITGGLPKLVILAQFSGEDGEKVASQTAKAAGALGGLRVKTRIVKNDEEAKKYWVIRRESFNLLRHHLRGKRTAPFIDDFVVRPDKLSEFWPKLHQILDQYDLTYTIAGHVGEGNFHIIPLMDLSDPKTKKIIKELSKKVYDLVFAYQGSTTGEHNDGLIRSPFLPEMFGDKVYQMFKEVKNIFDPRGIFNPGKKIGVDLDHSLEYLSE